MDDQQSKIINDLTAELNNYEEKLNTIFKELNWDIDTITEYEKEASNLVTCPFDNGHKVQEKSYKDHYKRCELKYHGIKDEKRKRRQLPSSQFFYEQSPIVISLVQNPAPDESFSSVRQPLSVSQRLGSYLADIDLSNKIRQEQHKPVRDEYKDFDEVWEALQRMKEQQNQGQKSRAELLAEMRDYKRRRKSYRAKNISITNRTATQVHHDLIAAFTEDYKLLHEFGDMLLDAVRDEGHNDKHVMSR
ncbi:1321_t:CDS:2 [Paraglomus brasilianum]|uniref:1321_t:CDS:1 n=1 Tax=Paraglomus brasilianum TaxID=144538 RepID=A0A9N8W6C6_9GLOM|nr:1321_t:CDS:2 [Paraglomus brasilianum]